MTKEEAISVLEELGGTQSNAPEYEACHIAIRALANLDEMVKDSITKIRAALDTLELEYAEIIHYKRFVENDFTK